MQALTGLRPRALHLSSNPKAWGWTRILALASSSGSSGGIPEPESQDFLLISHFSKVLCTAHSWNFPPPPHHLGCVSWEDEAARFAVFSGGRRGPC